LRTTHYNITIHFIFFEREKIESKREILHHFIFKESHKIFIDNIISFIIQALLNYNYLA